MTLLLENNTVHMVLIEDHDVECLVGNDLFQPSVLVFQSSEPFGFAYGHATEFSRHR